ncbi:hypothetical protein [Streptomyces sp. NPDC001652]|uniref:hypothetical protein n=1 Tax=Streptomyces sp. NPDC001652 TaxID=3154393 RepID=UPI00332FB09B
MTPVSSRSDEMGALRRHESEHANRAMVMRLLEARLDRPSADTTASSDAGRGDPMAPDPPHGTPDQPAKPRANRT